MEQKMLWSFALIVCVVDLVSGLSYGFPDDRCFRARTVTGCKDSDVGCNGTLLNVFTRISNYDERKNGPNVPDTQFLLFTRSNKIRPEFLHNCFGRLPKNTKFNPKSQTVVIVHDILDGTCRTPWMREMKDQLLIRDNYNVILVDWTWVDFEYPLQDNLLLVSAHIAYVVKNIMKDKKIEGDMFHFIGHGLGANSAGFAGRIISDTEPHESKEIRRITVLDPSCMNEAYIVSRNHASTVDVIHTKEGECNDQITFGYSKGIGNADFYVNRGKPLQSSVVDQFASAKKGENYYAFLCQDRAICDHYQAINYFMASINACNCEFVSRKCKIDTTKIFCGEKGEECAVMGMDWELYPPDTRTKKGSATEYCVELKTTYPYCDKSFYNDYMRHYNITKKKKFCTE